MSDTMDQRVITETVTTGVWTITPDDARLWLESHNTHNRPLSKTCVERLRREIAAGKWQVTSQGIGFDTAGRLVDGQHRLAAIAAGTTTVDMVVTTGLNEESFTRIDTGRARSVADMITFADPNTGSAGATYLGTSLRILHCYFIDPRRPWPTTSSSNAPTKEDLVHLHLSIGKSVARHHAEARRIGTRIGASIGAIMAALYVIEQWAQRYGSEGDFAEWTAQFASGAGIPEGDGRLAVASWARGLGCKSLSPAIRTEVMFMIVLRAWRARAYREDFLRVSLRSASTYSVVLPEEFPEVVAAEAERAAVEPAA